MTNRFLFTLFFSLLLAGSLTACTPEIGSESWCKQMQEKPKGDWSTNEAADFAQHCLFK